MQVRHIAFVLLSIAIVILLLQFMQPVLLPLVLGALLFYALDPAVDRLQKLHVPRAIGAALMLFIAVTICGVLAYTLQGQALRVIDQLPAGARKLAASLRTAPGAEPGAVEKVQLAADELKATEKSSAPKGVTRVQIEEPGFKATTFVWSTSMGFASAANQLIMVLFLTYFMLLSDQLFKRKLVEIVGTLSQKKVTVTVLEDIAGQIEQFLVIQLATSGIVAVVTGVALWAMGLQQAALWGLLAGFFNSIPYYGPLLVTGGLALVGFLQFGTIGMTIAVAGVSVLITTLEGSLLTPMLMGRAASMNQVAVFVGLLFWSWVWGVWGMLLAVPMMMVIKVICDHVEPLQPVGHLLGE
ncbi:MAG TPA: AI-2E family transporter [Vicinamibacterales bacterium]|jgi:predicted PurR-regulated permease PerM|nr:AI-2E family transporter [Vicinamibacterales bacterium]